MNDHCEKTEDKPVSSSLINADTAPVLAGDSTAHGGEKKETFKEKLVTEISEIAIVMTYLATSFCIIQTFKCATLLINCSENDFKQSYITAVVTALLIGKFVFILEKMKIAKRFDDKPLIYPVFYKSILFTVLMNWCLQAEDHLFGKHERHATELTNPHTFWYCWLAHQFAFFVTFFVFFAFREIGSVVGQKRLRRLFFISRE